MYKKCEVCIKEFWSPNNKQRSCSRNCGKVISTRKSIKITKKCIICNKEFLSFPSQPILHCSKKCSIITVKKKLKKHGLPKNWHSKIGFKSKENNIKWNGGRSKSCKYIKILVENHPYSHSDGYVFEHRLVMEKHLGRYLDPKEIIHHIDMNEHNNNINNLILFENNLKHMRHHYDLRKK